jgi:hypothetical protein
MRSYILQKGLKNYYTPSIGMAADSDSGYHSASLNLGEEQIILKITKTVIPVFLMLASI